MANRGLSKDTNEIEDLEEELQNACEGVDPVKSPELDECVESSQLSHFLWKKSLRDGCLNKSLKEKAKLFSHVRQLTSQTNLPLESIPTLSDEKHQRNTSSSVIDADGHVTTATSSIIVEDISRPPHASEEAVPLSFTDDALFSFLSSNEWGGSKMVRLISGNFLQRMLRSLYVLEAKGMIFTRSTRAYLNNGYWKTPQKEDFGELHHEYLPETEAKEWINEKILVDMVFYGKVTSKSSRESLIENCKDKTPDIAKLIVKPPAAHRRHPTDNLKLPPGEGKNPLSKINRLRCEFATLKESKERELIQKQIAAADAAKPKDKKKQDESNEKELKLDKGYYDRIGSIDIEDVADDPYLVPEGRKNNMETTPVPTKENESKSKISRYSIHRRDTEVKKVSDIGVSLSHMSADKSQESQVKLKESIGKEEREKLDKQFDPESIENTDTLKDVENIEDKSESDIISRSLSKTISSVKTYLNLSGNELYVSGLYRERDENAQPIALRLHQANEHRLKQRRETAKHVFNKLYQSREVDLNTRFKRLADAKELKRRKAMAAKLTAPRKELVQSQTRIKTMEGPWTSYYNDQEEMEMRVATDRDLEKTVLKRVTDKQRAQEDSDHFKKSKHEKNKNRNKHSSYSVNDTTNNARKSNKQNYGETNGKLRSCLKTNGAERRTPTHILGQIKDSRPSDALVEGQRNGLDALNPKGRFKPKKIRFSPTITNIYKNDDVEAILFWDKTAQFYECNKLECNNLLDKRDNKTRLPPLVRSSPDKVGTQKLQPGLDDTRNPMTFVSHTRRWKPYRRHWRRASQYNYNRIRKFTDDRNSNSVDHSNEHSGSIDQTGSASEIKEVMSEINDPPKSSTLPTPTPFGPSDSEILQHDLARFNVGCDCYECGSDDLDDLRPDCRDLPFLYPFKLGVLKKSFNYLKNVKECRAVSSPWEVSRCLQGMDDERLREEIISLLDKMVIRKEILASSLGNTFTTIVFIK